MFRLSWFQKGDSMRGLFSFRGRVGRLGYWRAVLLAIALAALSLALGSFGVMTLGPWMGVLLAPIPVALVINIAAAQRRLHDRGKGWGWLILFGVGPLACAGVAAGLVPSDEPPALIAQLFALPFSLGGLVLSVWGLVEIGFLRGQPLANRYGPPPAPAPVVGGAEPLETA
jgi:uncharacterized membrane protein YhaH (DUF805 family)